MSERERGQITVMVVGFFMVIGLLAVVVINASAAFLQRQELNNVADGAALAAADGLRRESIYRNGIDADAPIDPRLARELVGRYLADTGNVVAVWQVTTEDGKIRVHLERQIDLAITPPGWQARTRVTSDASALLRIAD